MSIRLVAISVCWVHSAAAATPALDNGVTGFSSSDSKQAAVEILETRCGQVREVTVKPPSFPLAEDEEVHLVCRDYSAAGVTVDALALTFADDKLVMLYAKGNAADVFLGFATGEVQEYLHFSASFRDYIVVDQASDEAWVMTAQAAHPNLFMWTNPYVENTERAEYDTSADTPDILKFGAPLDELLPLYEAQCDFSHLGTYRVWLLTQPKLQQQIDCFGFEFAGYPRKIEAVFGDGILEQAWILTGKGEEQRVREALIAEYGKPVFVNDDWEVFDQKQVMLRKDKPEVLLLSRRLADLYFEQEVDTR